MYVTSLLTIYISSMKTENLEGFVPAMPVKQLIATAAVISLPEACHSLAV
jgi:hypothetical protein